MLDGPGPLVVATRQPRNQLQWDCFDHDSTEKNPRCGGSRRIQADPKNTHPKRLIEHIGPGKPGVPIWDSRTRLPQPPLAPSASATPQSRGSGSPRPKQESLAPRPLLSAAACARAAGRVPVAGAEEVARRWLEDLGRRRPCPDTWTEGHDHGVGSAGYVSMTLAPRCPSES